MKFRNDWVQRDRLAGGMIGLLVGDALGVPYEFHLPKALPPPDQIEYQPPSGFRRSHAGVPPGTWSDDGAHALVLLDSLLQRNSLDLDHLAAGLRRWLTEGYFAVNRSVFDIGSQTSTALNRLADGVPADRSGPSEERHNGNGSLMRVLPLALWHQGTDEELVRLADRQSLPTHGHARSRITCALYCLLAQALLDDSSSAWDEAILRLRACAPAMEWPEGDLDIVLDPANATRVSGTGYVVDTLWSARQALEATDSYEACVRHAIGLGQDTDTTAAVAGGLAGLVYGLNGIPARWRQGLRGEALYQPLLEQLLQRRFPRPERLTVARTSQSHPLRIGITFCPGKQQSDAVTGVWARDLELDLVVIRDWGARHVVTLVEAHELESLCVTKLPERVSGLGMRWHHLPIVDGSIPDRAFERAWAAVLPQLKQSLGEGHGVIVHCKGGLGRAGTIAAKLLLELSPDVEPAEAMCRVREVREGAIETRVQERYVLRLRRTSVESSL